MIYDDTLSPLIYVTKGKTTHKQPNAVDVKLQTVELPPEIKNYYNNVQLLAGMMHENDILFLISVSQNAYYGVVGAVKNMTCLVLEHEIRKILRSYAVRGFNIVVILVNKRFKSLKERNKVRVSFNLVSKEEHAPAIESLPLSSVRKIQML